MSIKRIAGALWIQNDFPATPIILKMNFPFCLVAHVLFFSFLSANAFVRFLLFFVLDSSVLGGNVSCGMWKSKPLLTHTYTPMPHFLFLMCNSYSCGCATVFGIHQRIYPNQQRQYIQFWFFGNPLVMSNRWVKNLCDNSFTHMHTHGKECGMWNV